MSVKLVDFDPQAAQVANDLFYLLEGEGAYDLFDDESENWLHDWSTTGIVLQGLTEGNALYGVIARRFDAYNMVPFGVIRITCKGDFDAMQQEIERLRQSWRNQFGHEDTFCATGVYVIAQSGLLD